MWWRIAFSIGVFIALCVGMGSFFSESVFAENSFSGAGAGDDFSMTSPEFGHNEKIPSMFTCDGGNVSPPLAFHAIPEDAKCLALIMDDPDAPLGTWDHWLLVMPVGQGIVENGMPANAVLGKNSWGRSEYGGPCPPDGTHRYVFRLFALDAVPGVKRGFSKAELLRAMEGHVLDEALLIGLYR
ncbi:YbhB/YbcL family Raf kinase inhibitor-like protein [Prosthecochloris sp.]|uniref:YbhB/YbcL family Raf kinase inhibitor-like protein n=1 Tax=Prosthecochloris sp. TaxID=290513 RepID=UPI00258049BF|nr:YbhB/YbcL family Raf kinase inhibitor-like protein [Prosthecochloris sp.]